MKSNRLIVSILILAILPQFVILPASRALGAEINVAAASDLTFALKDVAARFEKETGDSIAVSFGSSGNFFSQIQNGAPYDLFFSADVGYPKRLAAAGLVEPESLFEYARGRLVMWVPSGSRLDLARGLNLLGDARITRIAIANPEHAPYGAAAVAAMRHTGIYDQVKGKLVMGENISQTAQFVQSGNANVGLLALSLALAPAMRDGGRYVEVPADDYPPIVQAAVILKASKNKDTARQFLGFLKKPSMTAILAKYGFMAPDANDKINPGSAN